MFMFMAECVLDFDGVLNLIDLWGFSRGEGFLRCFRGVWKLGYIGIAYFCGVLMYFTMICAEIRFGWDYVATRVA